jgi:hypothetical protein
MSDEVEVGGLWNRDTEKPQLTVKIIDGEIRINFYPPMEALTLAELAERAAACGAGGATTPTATLTLCPLQADGLADLLSIATAYVAGDAVVEAGDDDAEAESGYLPWQDVTVLATVSDTVDEWLGRYRAAAEPPTTAQIVEDLIAASGTVDDNDAANTALILISLGTALQKLISGDR